MKSDSLRRRLRFCWVVLLPLATLWVRSANAQQLDQTWTVTVNGQTVPVSSNGGFVVPNIAVVDVDPVDFVSDDFLRVGASSGDTILIWRHGSLPKCEISIMSPEFAVP